MIIVVYLYFKALKKRVGYSGFPNSASVIHIIILAHIGTLNAASTSSTGFSSTVLTTDINLYVTLLRCNYMFNYVKLCSHIRAIERKVTSRVGQSFVISKLLHSSRNINLFLDMPLKINIFFFLILSYFVKKYNRRDSF